MIFSRSESILPSRDGQEIKEALLYDVKAFTREKSPNDSSVHFMKKKHKNVSHKKGCEELHDNGEEKGREDRRELEVFEKDTEEAKSLLKGTNGINRRNENDSEQGKHDEDDTS